MELECIDRMYLNAYVPQLTSEAGIAAFCRGYLGHRFASTKQAVAMTKAFVKSIETFYCCDRDFGPFFLKFCSYFPYSAKLCLNGHEYLKCQLAQRNIAFEALDVSAFGSGSAPGH